MGHLLQDWLRGPAFDYSEGVHLYSLYGKYESVLKLLQGDVSDQKRDKLKDALRETWAAIKPDIEARVAEAQKFAAAAPVRKMMPPGGSNETPQAAAAISREADKVVLDIDKKWKPLYAEMAMMHARLGVCETDTQRYNLALRITELDEQIIKLWAERDGYLATGQLPEKPKKKITKAKELPANDYAELVRLRTYVTKMVNKVAPSLAAQQLTKPTKRRAQRIIDNQAKLAKWQQRVNELEYGGG